jgi:hypothetical protein
MARPVIAAMNEQQEQITALRNHAAKQDQVIQAQAEAIDRLIARDQVHVQRTSMLTRGLYTLSSLAGGDLVRQVTASMSKRADQQNPAQPVPEPPAEPAPFSTAETEMPEAFADVTSPGLAPGTTNDVAADATSTVYTPGTDVDMPALNNLIDVTAPVDGTQNPRPLNEVKTHTDVRVGDPMNPQTAWPVQGPWATSTRWPRTSSATPSVPPPPSSPRSRTASATPRPRRRTPRTPTRRGVSFPVPLRRVVVPFPRCSRPLPPVPDRLALPTTTRVTCSTDPVNPCLSPTRR